MKFSLVILVTLCAVALSVPTTQHGKSSKSDRIFLERQKHILQLLYRVLQHENLHPEYEQIAKTYSIIEHADCYTKQEVVKNFVHYWKNEILPRRAVFSIRDQHHMEQAVVLSKLLYYAKDWETFFKTAVWARQNVNEAMFVYAFTVALVHRSDTKEFVIPPIYEVYPHYFFNTEVIHYAQVHKQRYDPSSHDKTYHTIVSNYSGWYLNLHPEQSMSYYLEDIGLNAAHYYFNIYFPTWMTDKELGWKDSRRGEVFYYRIQQVLAHYYSERISNGFGEIPHIEWDTPIETSFEPSLVYPNGLHFPNRPKFANLHEYFYNYGQKWSDNVYGYSQNFIQDYEERINNAIDRGLFVTNDRMLEVKKEEALNVLGNLITSNANSLSKSYYGDIMNVASHLLGYSMQALDHEKLVPSALEHFETTLRDPVFYQLLKKIFYTFERYMALHVPSYTEKNLVVPGVEITNMKVDSLVTYNDYFFSDLSNAVFYHPREKLDFHVRARQTRLNHKPFNVKIHIKSDKEQKVSIKLYMSPKFDEWGRTLNLTENRRNMMELDRWTLNLKSGGNDVIRNSKDFRWFSDDRRGYVELYKSVTEAIDNNEEFIIDVKHNFMYWPRRYMIPKGSRGGTEFQFVVVVYPHERRSIVHDDPQTIVSSLSSGIFDDNKPLFYPFERVIKFEKMWYRIPNIYFHDELVYFKEDVNSSHQ